MRSHIPAPVGRDGEIFLTDASLETSLIFYDGIDLPCFASYPLLEIEDGRRRLTAYFQPILRLARDRRAGFILDTLTWRANAEWGARLGYDAQALDQVNRWAVAFAVELGRDTAGLHHPVVVSGTIGPRDDGYQPAQRMTADEAERYHAVQIATFAETTVDMVTAFTLTSIEEAIGIAHAARAHDIPVALSFTLETDGTLPSGDTLRGPSIARPMRRPPTI